MTIDDIVETMKQRYPCFILSVVIPDVGDLSDINTFIKGEVGACVQLVDQIGFAIDKAIEAAEKREPDGDE